MVPRLTIRDALPVAFPQLALVEEIIREGPAVLVMVTDVVAVNEFASVTVTEYVPAPAPVPPPVKAVSFPGVSDEVWAALPFEMQTELLVSVGMQAEADALLDSEITATGVCLCVCVCGLT